MLLLALRRHRSENLVLIVDRMKLAMFQRVVPACAGRILVLRRRNQEVRVLWVSSVHCDEKLDHQMTNATTEVTLV